ncbi:hypothetical protein IK146_03160 [Candidatus Saccharibacteria bacterium]|nr:hypothetical protein [Candidatus Saccharibacteria bacterium]
MRKHKKIDGFTLSAMIAMIIFMAMVFTVAILPSISAAEAAPRPIASPMECQPTAEELNEPIPTDEPFADGNYYTVGVNRTITVSMYGGEAKSFNLIFKGNLGANETAYMIEKEIEIVTVDEEEIAEITNDWVAIWNVQEGETFVVNNKDEQTVEFELLPPENAPAGEYVVIYRILSAPLPVYNLDIDGEFRLIQLSPDMEEYDELTFVMTIAP